MSEALALGGNPSSVHSEGREVRRMLEAARTTLAAYLGVQANRIIFTSGATEANAAVINQAGGRVLVAATEHPSVLIHSRFEPIRVDSNGLIDQGDLSAKLKRDQPALVSVMAVNNETGVLQPIEEIAVAVEAAGARLHVDAVQALGRIDLAGMDADYLTLSGHKIGGPKGTGAIVVPDGVPWQPLILGGGQELRRRSGTENCAAAVGFAAALAALEATEAQRLARLRDEFERRLAIEAKATSIVALGAPKAPHISGITINDKRAETMVMQLDLAGIAVSAGSACSSGKVQRSHVLEAMGLGPAAESTLRISFGWTNHEVDIDRLIQALSRVKSSPA